MTFTIRGDMTVPHVSVTLTDGRIVTLHPDGTMYVQAGKNDSNEYVLDLPTVGDVATRCDEINNPREDDTRREVLIPVYHRH